MSWSVEFEEQRKCVRQTLASVNDMECHWNDMKKEFTDNFKEGAAFFGLDVVQKRPIPIIPSPSSDHPPIKNIKYQPNSIANPKNMKHEREWNVGDCVQYKHVKMNGNCESSDWDKGEGVITDVFKHAETDESMIKIKVKYDDDDSKARWTNTFTEECVAQNATLYGFKLYKHKHRDFPFAIKTDRCDDYVIGRVLHWNKGTQFFMQKLEAADHIEGYEENGKSNLYEREVVDVVANGNEVLKAIVYFGSGVDMTDAIEIPKGDWLRRN